MPPVGASWRTNKLYLPPVFASLCQEAPSCSKNPHCRVAAKKELLTDAHRTSRLAFAEQHANKGLDFWSQVIFCDEKTFRSSDHGRVRVWRRDNTRYEPRNICMETRKRPRHLCNVLEGFQHGVGDVVNIEGEVQR
ncbi:hypothetical protein GWK47_035627 [Chionoecetes opilio]|uniref:Transposase Tc1-like domain-containing protein n=1 Tax=Chionoecetes opilio TaxID=41210 RepID=A0A8J4YQ19_CHIOP|nr:hypothetical protein GWK47_035627 [Chionoecetes opilio]